MSCKSAMSLMMTGESINQCINKLVELQSKPNAGSLLDQLGLTFVDVNHIINLLGEYDKIIDHVLETTNTQWPPNLDNFLWSQ